MKCNPHEQIQQLKKKRLMKTRPRANSSLPLPPSKKIKHLIVHPRNNIAEGRPTHTQTHTQSHNRTHSSVLSSPLATVECGVISATITCGGVCRTARHLPHQVPSARRSSAPIPLVVTLPIFRRFVSLWEDCPLWVGVWRLFGESYFGKGLASG